MNSLPTDWDFERNRDEFLKWLEIFSRSVSSVPTDWVVWQQTRSFQEILSELAKRLGFRHGPIERREEKFTITGDKGKEEHERNWVIATDPLTNSIAERFDGWVNRSFMSHGVRGGMPDSEFGAEVVNRIARWREAVKALQAL